jgi:hypothetical protein
MLGAPCYRMISEGRILVTFEMRRKSPSSLAP